MWFPYCLVRRQQQQQQSKENRKHKMSSSSHATVIDNDFEGQTLSHMQSDTGRHVVVK